MLIPGTRGAATKRSCERPSVPLLKCAPRSAQAAALPCCLPVCYAFCAVCCVAPPAVGTRPALAPGSRCGSNRFSSILRRGCELGPLCGAPIGCAVQASRSSVCWLGGAPLTSEGRDCVGPCACGAQELVLVAGSSSAWSLHTLMPSGSWYAKLWVGGFELGYGVGPALFRWGALRCGPWGGRWMDWHCGRRLCG
mmetsp:Transcript_26603/g.62072  ORF Transcript_26603/g.62072 Transcript_26603/m.62072 type:complete len:195 (+) Transcript_26603:88-672(+)